MQATQPLPLRGSSAWHVGLFESQGAQDAPRDIARKTSSGQLARQL
jgi:hypothetical protein